MQNKATIIILDYFKAKRVKENVLSFLKQKTDFSFEIIVVDNSCDEGNAKILEELKNLSNVEVIINKKNKGYSKAYNDIARKTDSKYLFIVNPDIVCDDENSLQKIINYMDENKNIGILGPKQINDNTNKTAMTVRAFSKLYLQIARRTFFRYLWVLKNKVKYDEMQHLDYEKIQDVDWVQSSFIVVRKKLWDKLSGFNAKYFLFMADVELCFLSWKNKYRVVYFPKAVVRADGERLSVGGGMKFFQSKVLRQHFKDAIKYKLKHLVDKNPRKEYYKKI